MRLPYPRRNFGELERLGSSLNPSLSHSMGIVHSARLTGYSRRFDCPGGFAQLEIRWFPRKCTEPREMPPPETRL